MNFDNKTKQQMNSDLVREEARLPAVSSSVLFEIFPFIIVFGEDMVTKSISIEYQWVRIIFPVSFVVFINFYGNN